MDEILDELRALWDPWASMPAPIPYFLFGSGSRRPFSAYFDGPSRVSVSSISELERWLHACSYVSDKTLFGRDDYWQLPGEFELIRMGDCDDHALWAWRKFVELGHEASLVVGRWHADSDELHVWLLLSMGGEQLIYEATSKVLGEALRPFEEVREDYLPRFSVDQRFRTRAFLGSVQDLVGFTGDWVRTR